MKVRDDPKYTEAADTAVERFGRSFRRSFSPFAVPAFKRLILESVYSYLSPSELIALLELFYRALTVTTEKEFKDLLCRTGCLVPCDYIAACLGRTDRSGHFLEFMKLIDCTYPSGWLAHYEKEGYASVDPVLQSHFGAFKTQVWSETFRWATARDEKTFLEEARGCGLLEGITVGMASQRRLAGSLFSFAGQKMSEHSRHRVVLEYLAPALHLALMRDALSHSTETPCLTERQREILQWMKEGKTNGEIGLILKISERTVKFHVQHIFEKLDAVSRSQVVALAIEMGLIQL